MVGIAYKVETHVFNPEVQDTPEFKEKRDEAYEKLFLGTDASKQKFARRLLIALRKKSKDTTKLDSNVLYAALHLSDFDPRVLADLAQHNSDVLNLIFG